MEIRLGWIEAGEGFPLVLLHGNQEDHTYFQNQMGPFSEHFRVLAVDTRGHGITPRGSAPFTIDQFAEDLKFFLDDHGIDRCHLLGFSDGGNIALTFALRWPGYVDHLILNGANLDPSGVNPKDQKEFEDTWRDLERVRALHPLSGTDLRQWEFLDLMVSQPHIDPESLASLTMPVLVVAGERDVILEEHTRLIARKIPGSTLRILPGDHFVARRNPGIFNETILSFLPEGRKH